MPDKLLELAQSRTAQENPLSLLRQQNPERGAAYQVVRTSQPVERKEATPYQPSWERQLPSPTPSSETHSPAIVAPPGKRTSEPEPNLTRTLQQRIDRALSGCTTVEKFSARLQQMGVETRLLTQRSGAINGISYHYQDSSATGYELGPGYTWAAISERLERNYKHSQQQQAEEAARLEAQRQEQQRHRQLEQLKPPLEAAQPEQLKAASRQVTAEETLKLKRQVDSYFTAAPPNCPDSDLVAALEQHRYWLETVGQLAKQFEGLEQQLNSANSFQRLLPSYSRKLEVAATTAQEWHSAVTKSDSASSELKRLQRQRQQYLEWEQSPSTQEIRRQQDYLQTPERQQLIALALELERIRELELKRQLEQTLNQVRQWYLTAQKLNQPPEYLNRIVEIAQQFIAGTPLPDKAIAAMQADRREELLKSRHRGLSL